MQENREVNNKALSFDHFFTDHKINRWVLIDAFNGAQTICGPKGERIIFKTPAELNQALADINGGVKDRYKMTAPTRLGNALNKYEIPLQGLFYSQRLIYEALLFHYETEIRLQLTNLENKLVNLSNELADDKEIIAVKNEIQNITTNAAKQFATRLKETGAQIKDTIFTRLYDFFALPSLGRDIVLGLGMGLVTVGAIAGAIALSVGTAGVAPAVLGVTAATLSPVGLGLSLGALGAGIVGFFTTLSAGIGAYVRSKGNNNSNQQATTTMQKTAVSSDPVAQPNSTQAILEIIDAQPASSLNDLLENNQKASKANEERISEKDFSSEEETYEGPRVSKSSAHSEEDSEEGSDKADSGSFRI